MDKKNQIDNTKSKIFDAKKSNNIYEETQLYKPFSLINIEDYI